ncbi:hypothetical protein GCM10027402_12370 [Arthrobacter monumenti]
MTAGCGNQQGDAVFDGPISTGPNGEILLINPDSGSDNFEMEAAFEGTLALGDGNCIIGRTTQGQESTLVFPADTRLPGNGSMTLKVDGRSIEIVAPVTFGGGFLTGAHLEILLTNAPKECRRAETFYVQNIQ